MGERDLNTTSSTLDSSYDEVTVKRDNKSPDRSSIKSKKICIHDNRKGGTNNKMMVALVDSEVDKKWTIDLNATVVRLPTPSSCKTTITKPGKDAEELSSLLDYLQISDGTIFEIQALPATPTTTTGPENNNNATYGSFFVGNMVVSNGNLHVVSRIDPLFWVLPQMQDQLAPTEEPQSSSNQQWQPLDQILSQFDPILAKALLVDTEQLLHLFKRMSISSDGDEFYYKFSIDKTRKWLKRKYEQTYIALKQQQQVKEQNIKRLQQRKLRYMSYGGCSNMSGSVGAGGNGAGNAAFSDNFIMPGEPTEPQQQPKQEDKNASKKVVTIKDDSDSIKTESLQIICNYLTPEWQQDFFQYMNVSQRRQQEVLGTPELKSGNRKRMRPDDQTSSPSMETTSSSTTNIVSPLPNAKSDANKNNNFRDLLMGVLPNNNGDSSKDTSSQGTRTTISTSTQAKTYGAKQLAKVNKKGMKSLSTFFTVKKKNKTS